VKVQVTRADINDGRPGQPYACAIALAVKRAGATRVLVDDKGMWVDGGFYSLPPEASLFVARFDAQACDRSQLEPFEFEAEERP
jgi:hypothetical protein